MARLADRPRPARTDHARLAVAGASWERARQPRGPAAHRPAPGRAGRTPRLPEPRCRGDGRRDRGDARGGRRPALLARPGRRRERRGRARRPLPHGRLRRRGLGLGTRDGGPARRAVRRGQFGAAALLRGRPRPARRGVPRRRRPVRTDVHRTLGPARLQRRGPGLRGARRLRGGGRALPARPLHTGRQAWRCLDEPRRRAVTPARHAARRREQPQRGEARRRLPHAADPGRGRDALPRVRARAARAHRQDDLPTVLGHERRTGLRGVPLAGQRDVGDLALGPRELREAPRDRRAAAARARARTERLRRLQRGLLDHRVPRRGAARPGVAPSVGRRGRRGDRRRGVRAPGLASAAST